ncbi:MAG: LysR family transcriptional regulator [Cereibacter sphaeroides]|uniref:LysR family transcriptional regulator n=1 Tax=Cereibacter sphaeroides TaxID=1063 RepID=A0A2W5SL24_CERSP|nr:MAG: LysR family transcriptional regulator [Cereibacter sphaeroides]
MKSITLKQMRYFEALARHRHFGRAAEDCAISQPALSMKVRELEDVVGTPLLERNARQMRLTGFGEVFLSRARSILRSVDELEDLSRATGAKPAGILRIGVIPTVAPYLLPSIIANLSHQFPDLSPSLRETVTSRLVTEIVDGRLDAAILALPLSEPSLVEVALFSERFVLVRPMIDARRPVPSRDVLQEMRLLLLEEGHCFREQALSFCSMPSSRPREMLDGSNLSTLVQMVGAGIGVTLIPEMAVPVETRSAAVAVSHFPDPQPTRTIGMVWRKSSPLEQHLRQIAEVVRASATVDKHGPDAKSSDSPNVTENLSS